MGLLSALKKKVATALDYVSAPLSQPLTFVTKGPTAAAKAVSESRKAISLGQESGVKKIGSIVLTTGIVAGGILAAAPSASTGAAGVTARTVAKAILPTTKKGIAATIVTAPIVYGLIKSNPERSQKLLEEAPAKGAKFGENLGNLINDPSKQNAVDLYKDSPVLTSAALLAALAPLGLGALTLASNVSNTRAVKENTEVYKTGQTQNIIQDPAPQIIQIQQLPPPPQPVQAPISAPVTQSPTITKTTPKKATKKKAKKKKKAPAKHKYKSRKKVNGRWVYKY